MKLYRLFLVLLLSVFVPALTIAQAPKTGETKKTQAKKSAPAPNLMDINSASAEALKSLPGIGEAYSKKIVDSRPYKAKDELWQRKIIPKATYEKIKDKVIAHQAK
jgi:DNA uptake protein ComE-like DNA-binding protein